MKNREQAEKLLRETASAIGCELVGAYSPCVLAPSPDDDSLEARMCTTFSGTPEALAELVKQRCGEAKAAIIAQLKATLARLESLPG